MAIVRAGPNEYLLVGKRGVLENRGSAVSTYLWPGTIYVLVPSTKIEAEFAFTQETKDGVPLRFKGTFIYRISDPVAAAAMFDFTRGEGTTQITTLLTHVVFGELRHAVSHMTMNECIEQRKTTLSGVVAAALEGTIRSDGEAHREWGIAIESSQVAQVFIVDATLRQQLEAEVRNEIRTKADASNIAAQEQLRLAELASENRIKEQRLAADRDNLRREEELETTVVARQRRALAEQLETDRQTLVIEQQRLHAQLAAEEDRITAEAPLRRLRTATERDLLAVEIEMREVQNRAAALAVEHDLLARRAEQDLRREILPLEQAPALVASASRLFQGSNLSIYGEGSDVLRALAPLLDLLARAVPSPQPAAGAPAITEDVAPVG